MEHLKIETRLKYKRVESVMGKCDLEFIGVSSIFKTIRHTTTLPRMRNDKTRSKEKTYI